MDNAGQKPLHENDQGNDDGRFKDDREIMSGSGIGGGDQRFDDDPRWQK